MGIRNLCLVIAALFLGTLATSPRACSTCGCSLTSDWVSQGYTMETGFRMDLRFDYFDQDTLRTGRDKVDMGSISFPSEKEIQLSTINRDMTFDLGYDISYSWGFDLILPTHVRTHGTVAEDDAVSSYSRSSGLGDIRLLAHYQGFLGDHSLGLKFGLSLPTGRRDDVFSEGPQAGNLVDRGLQLGTGTTGLILGLYKFWTLDCKWSLFAQGEVNLPLNSSDGFRPGNSLTSSAGLRYTASSRFSPQVQVNLRAEKPERGENADSENSGATLAYVSPGFTLRLGRALYAFAFVQVPIYQRVSGYQLEPGYLVSAGIHFRF